MYKFPYIYTWVCVCVCGYIKYPKILLNVVNSPPKCFFRNRLRLSAHKRVFTDDEIKIYICTRHRAGFKNKFVISNLN